MNYQFEVLTVHDVEFKDQSGKDVAGQQLWCIGATNEKSWNGWEVIKLWIPDGSPLEMDVASLKHGDQINVTFNRRGKPETIVLIG